MSKIFLNGIWKSGNNLMVKICQEMERPYANFGLASSLVIGDYYLARQWIRGAKLEKSPVPVGIDMPINISSNWLNAKIHNLSNQSFGGHCAYSDHIIDLLRKHGVKTIHIIRDPRDVIVSFAHWIVTRPDYYPYPYFKDLTLKERMKAVITGIDCGEFYLDGFATVMDRSYGWLTNPDDVLVVRFEDLVGEKGGGSDEAQKQSLRSIAEWIGYEADEERINQIAEKIFGGTHTFRKGQIGEWKNEFDEDLKMLFTRKIGHRLNAWGYF